MEVQKIVRFWRVTFQGIGIASLGTLGVKITIGAAILGIVSIIAALALHSVEQ